MYFRVLVAVFFMQLEVRSGFSGGLLILSEKREPHRSLYVGVLVAQLCPTLCNLVDCIPPGSSLHGIFQVRILEQVAISFSRGSC